MISAHSAPRALPPVRNVGAGRVRAPLLSRVGLAALAVLATSAAVSASAQSLLAPVVVIGSREPQPLDRLTADVVVIDAARIRASSADSVEDLLRREAGVQMSRNGGPGHSAGVFIRGANVSGTVVLIDGVRTGSASLGQVEFESLDLAQIDRIEVLRGPGSSLYGADAVGGVIQIFTKRGEGAPRVVANMAVGGYGSSLAGAGVSGAQAGVDYAASLGRERSRGVSVTTPGAYGYNPDTDGFARNTAQFKLGYMPAAGHRVGLNVVQSWINSQYDGAEPDDITTSSDFRTRLHSSVLALDYRGAITPSWTTTFQLAHNDDDSKAGGAYIYAFRTQRDQITGQAAWQPGVGQQFVFAYEHLNERASSTEYTSGVKRSNDAAVFGYTGQFDKQTFQLDVRHDANSVYGDSDTGRLGWSTEIAKNLRARALVGSTFRAPSFNDLFYPGFGVSTITPEHGRSAELGLTWRDADRDAALTVYRNRVRNLISYQFDASQCPAGTQPSQGCASNIGARIQGATLSGGQRWGAWQVRATVDFLDAQDLDKHVRLNRRAAHQESLAVDYGVAAWNVGASLLSVGARPDGTVNLGAYATVDLRARYRVTPQWQLEAKLLNATDHAVEPVRGYAAPGRQAWVGVRFDGRGF